MYYTYIYIYIYIYYDSRTVAFVIEHVVRYASYCHLSPALQYFQNYHIKGAIFGKKIIEQKMCVVIFSAIFV
jgi:hypothetical protein